MSRRPRTAEPGSPGSSSSGNGNVEFAVEEIDDQEARFEEIEKWDELAQEKIPEDQKPKFFQFTGKLSGFKRMPIYKAMADLEWEHQKLEGLYSLMSKIKIESLPDLMTLLNSFLPFGLFELCLTILVGLEEIKVKEVLFETTREIWTEIIQVARHLTARDVENIIDLINVRSVKDLLDMLHKCNEPFAGKCRQCRVKRMRELETRMLHDQHPPDLMKLPGNIPLYDNHQRWTACDEKGYTFDIYEGKIFYNRATVDIVHICDVCLLDVKEAITNHGRFEEINHISASERRTAFGNQRKLEQKLAHLIGTVAYEQTTRRLKELCLRALAAQRHGLTIEKNNRYRKEMDEKRRQEIATEKAAKAAIVAKATSVDKKWLTEDRASDIKRYDKRKTFALMNTDMGFQQENRPAEKIRQHPLSWRLADFDEFGVPMTADGAAQKFGYGNKPKDYSDDARIVHQWKVGVDESHEAYLARIAEEARLRRLREIQEHKELIIYINERSNILERKRNQMERMKEQKELDRVEKRHAEKMSRREHKYQVYLSNERDLLTHEDDRSYKLRFYEWECRQEDREREDMYSEYLEQTEVDRFWGLELFERRLNAEEKRLREVYAKRVQYFNNQLVGMKQIHKSMKGFEVTSLGSMDTKYRTADGGLSVPEEVRRNEIIRTLKVEEIRSELKHVRRIMATQPTR